MLSRNSKDLIVVVVLTIIAIGASLLQVNSPVTLPLLALPLAFLLPGYALTAALFPKGDLGFPETVTFSLGLSLAADIVGGVIINLTSDGLAVLPWTVFLVSVTLGGCAIAVQRRRHLRAPMPSQFVLGLSVGQALLLGLSVAVVTSALLLVRSQAVQPSTGFTQLWARPAAILGQTAFDLGVYNSESKNMEYQLEVKAGGELVTESFAIALAPGETWKKVLTFQVPVNGDVQVLLYRLDDPGKIYREVVSRSSAK